MPVPKDKKGDLLHTFKQGRRLGSQRTGTLIKNLPTPFKKKKNVPAQGIVHCSMYFSRSLHPNTM